MINARDLVPLLPVVLDLIERMVSTGHDPKQELERIKDGYRVRTGVESDVEKAARKKFGGP